MSEDDKEKFVFRRNALVVRPQPRGMVAVQIGDETKPEVIDAEDLRDALTEYINNG